MEAVMAGGNRRAKPAKGSAASQDVRIMIRLDRVTFDRVSDLATLERRSFSTMAHILIERGLASRENDPW